ncbi:MAG: tetratricopeptide repeat protein, partial [Anaerolineae bacterium]|nr:tetratricopeptide repeat protein [Anaerolineae bacterium]
QATSIRWLLIGFASATILAFLLYLPWWPVLFNILRNRAAVGAIEGGVGNPLTFIGGVVEALGPLPLTAAWGFLLLYLTGLILLARRQWPLAVLGLLWLGLPVLLPIVLGDPRALQFRYAFVLPVYLIIITYAIFTLTNGQRSIFNFQFSIYFIWVLATLSFIATLNIYNQNKPDWRGAAAYLTEHTQPADLIVFGPLWDEGRFVEYYYRGQAQLLTPAALVTNIQGRAESLRAHGGRIWAINRFAPAETPALKNLAFYGVVVSEPAVPVYEPPLLTEAAIGLAAQAVEAAYPWAAEAEAQGVLDPDPRTAQAVALRALGDTLVVAGRPQEALEAYQRAVEIFPGWVNGFVVLAETHETLGNLPAAAQAYQQAVAFNLQWQGPLAEQADQLVAAAEWEAALNTYHQIIDE